MDRQRRAVELQAYHDGELSWLGRWRIARRLTRDGDARRELDALQELGSLLREIDSEIPTPDLWSEIAKDLPPSPVELPAAADRPEPSSGWRPAWVAGIAAAGMALAVLVGTAGGPADAKSVRWLDPQGGAVMVLQDDADATIIWVPEPPKREVSYEGEHALG